MIHQLKNDGVSVSEISRRLKMDRKTVRRYIQQGLEPPAYGPRKPRGSCLDQYKDYLQARVGLQPGLSATRLLRDIKAMGFQGSYTTLTTFLRSIRPCDNHEYEVRFETPAGFQAQADFAHFAVRFTDEPEVERVVWLFSMVLGHSRYLFGRFSWRQTLDTVVRCHIEAFEAFGGVPQEILYDRMKTAVLGEPEPGQIVYHPTLMALAKHYGFMPKACKAYRAKTKGKVERPFRYIRQDFFLDGTFQNIEDLNAQFDRWLAQIAHTREHGTTRRIVQEHFQEERASLQPLPAGIFDDVLSSERRVTRDGMVSVDGNLYSVPNGLRLSSVQVERTATALRLIHEEQLLAVHPLLIGRGQRQVLEGHRARVKPHNSSTVATAPAIGGDGDEVVRRDLEVYSTVAKRLAQGENV